METVGKTAQTTTQNSRKVSNYEKGIKDIVNLVNSHICNYNKARKTALKLVTQDRVNEVIKAQKDLLAKMNPIAGLGYIHEVLIDIQKCEYLKSKSEYKLNMIYGIEEQHVSMKDTQWHEEQKAKQQDQSTQIIMSIKKAERATNALMNQALRKSEEE